MPNRDLSVYQFSDLKKTEQYTKDLNGNLVHPLPVNIKWTAWYRDDFIGKNRKLEIIAVRLTPTETVDTEWAINWTVDDEPPEKTQQRQQAQLNYRKLNDLPAPVESLGSKARRMFGIIGSLVVGLRYLGELCQPKICKMTLKNTTSADEAHIRIVEQALFVHHAGEIAAAGYRVEETPVTAKRGFMWEPAFYRQFQFVRVS